MILDFNALMRASQVSIAGLADVQLDPGTVEVRAAVGRSVRRPFGLNYRTWANTVIGLCMEPSRPAVAIDALPAGERRRLMARVAALSQQRKAWRALYGSLLSWDERFFAVMVWAWRRDRTRARRAAAERSAALGPQSITGFVPPPALAGLDPWPSLGLAKSFEAATEISKLTQNLLRPYAALRLPSRGNDNYDEVVRAATGVGGPALSAITGASAGGYDATAFNPNLLKSIEQAHQVSKSIERLHLHPGLAAAAHMRLAAGLKGLTAQKEIEQLIERAAGVSRSWGSMAEMYTTPGGPLANLRLAEQFSRRVLGPDLARFGLIDAGRFWTEPLAPWVLSEPDPAEERFFDQWEHDPLWFLVGELAVVVVKPLFALPREVFLGLVLDALEAAVLGGPLIAWLRSAVAQAPYLTDDQRSQLDCGLRDAAAGTWATASVLLLVGLEGAISVTPQVQRVVAASSRFSAAEVLVRHLGVDDTHELFVKARVYGGAGNKVRHGREGANHRQQTLLAIVALAGWLDTQARMQAMTRIIAALTSGLRGPGPI